MTTEEFSNEFDTLLNSYLVTGEFGKVENLSTIKLDEYEKSVFLTRAQEEIIISFYNGKNPFRDSFEKTEEIRRYLSSLVKTYTTTDKKTGYTGLSNTSIFFELPEDLWFITYESVSIEDDKECIDGKEILVVPVSQDEYYRISKNPFRCSNERRALRLDNSNKIVEIISKYNINRYLVRYITKPNPIILIDLPNNLSINNISNKTKCNLNTAIHRTILERAVKLAIFSRVPNADNKQIV